MRKINIFLTEAQLKAEQVHLGAGFNPKNYIRIQEKSLNEGLFGLVLSIPAIIKLFRFCIEKGQEYWLKIFYKELYDLIDHRTLASLLDEDTIEDLVAEKEGGYSEQQAKKVIKIIEIITKKSDYIVAAADSTSGVKTPHHHRSKEDIQKRRNRMEIFGDSPITVVAEVLGALQHGLHHVYTSLSNLIGKASVEAFESIFGNIKDQDDKQKIIDIIGNLFFVGLVFFALFGASSFSAMEGVKVLEIFVECCEVCELICGVAILTPHVKTIINKVKQLKTSFGDTIFSNCIEGLISNTPKKVKSFFKKVEKTLGAEIHSSRFAPEMLRSKTVKEKPEPTDYYDHAFPPPKSENYIREYIELLLRQIKSTL